MKEFNPYDLKIKDFNASNYSGFFSIKWIISKKLNYLTPLGKQKLF